MHSLCVRGRSKAISVGAGEAGSAREGEAGSAGAGEAGSARGQEDLPGTPVEVGSMESWVVLGLRICGGIAGVKGWAASEDDVPLHFKSRPRDNRPSVGWESCSNASLWRRFPSDMGQSTKLERTVSEGEESGGMTASDVVAWVITTTSSSLEG